MDYPKLKKKNFFNEKEKFVIQKAEVNMENELHSHEFIEIAYVLSGSGRHKIEEIEVPAEARDLYIMNTQVHHAFYPKENETRGLTVFNCLFEPVFIDISLSECGEFVDAIYHFFFQHVVDEKMPKFIKIKGNKEFDYLFCEMFQEYEKKEEGYLSCIKGDLTKLIVKIFRVYKEKYKEETGGFSERREMIENIIQYIKEHCDEPLHLNEVAALAFLSPSHFARIFKSETSQTLVQFIQNQRIETACSLLKNTDRSVEQVAEEVGYQDMKYFYEIFRKKTGFTPGQYRKMYS